MSRLDEARHAAQRRLAALMGAPWIAAVEAERCIKDLPAALPTEPVGVPYTLPEGVREAFVAGAAWHEFYETGATIWTSDRRNAEGEAERRYPTSEWIESPRLTAAGAEVARLSALLHECNAVCLCGCPASEHESYGEDGESCGNDGHECIRVAPAVLAHVDGLRKRGMPDGVREAAEEVRTYYDSALTPYTSFGEAVARFLKALSPAPTPEAECPDCGGVGRLPIRWPDGRIVFDSDGAPEYVPCERCGHTGKVAPAPDAAKGEQCNEKGPGAGGEPGGAAMVKP